MRTPRSWHPQCHCCRLEGSPRLSRTNGCAAGPISTRHVSGPSHKCSAGAAERERVQAINPAGPPRAGRAACRVSSFATFPAAADLALSRCLTIDLNRFSHKGLHFRNSGSIAAHHRPVTQPTSTTTAPTGRQRFHLHRVWVEPALRPLCPRITRAGRFRPTQANAFGRGGCAIRSPILEARLSGFHGVQSALRK
jgi:hypothetical protein